MMKFKKEDKQGLTKSVFMAYFILILHVILIAAMGILVIFFRGVIIYMHWIFLFGTALVGTSAWLFYKRMKHDGNTLKNFMQSADLGSRSFEISFFGGLATIRLGKNPEPPLIGSGHTGEIKQIEDSKTQSIRELSELVKLLENDLITIDEYEKFKRQILKLN